MLRLFILVLFYRKVQLFLTLTHKCVSLATSDDDVSTVLLTADAAEGKVERHLTSSDPRVKCKSL